VGYLEHYDELLAKHYSWMSGPLAEKVCTEKARLEALGIGSSGSGKLAVDLGSGPGYQAFALADLGFDRVLAVDTSEDLLGELITNAGGRSVEPVRMDILRLGKLVEPHSVHCVTCMGDTLTHLASREGVVDLFGSIHTALAPGASLVLSFRDLTRPRSGPHRFLMSRADNNRILSCFLEYVDDDFVLVHDIVHQRDGEQWTMRVSAYPKLRLSSDWIAQQLRDCGFDVATVKTDGSGWTILKGTARAA
jgi:SAM-dependent methyltransferase